MSQTVIHIGLHKTASTFLQNQVFPTLANTTYLSRPYTQLNHAFNKLQYADDTRYSKEEFLSEVAQFDGQHIFVSDEMLSGIPFFNYINRSTVAHRLKEVFPEAKIILFLRGQKDIIFSLYNTWIKNLKGHQTLEKFFWAPKRNYTFEEFHPGQGFDNSAYFFQHDALSLNFSNFFYFELVSLYKSLFDDVHIFLFEDFSANPIGVLHHIEDILSDKFKDLDSKFSKTRKTNTSLQLDDLEYRRISNTFGYIVPDRKLRGAFTRGYSWLQKAFFQQDYAADLADFEQRVSDLYLENNRKLLATYPEIGIDKYPEKYQIEG